MTTEEAQKLLDELQEVRPEVLNDEAKRLFETIMKIVDERNLYKSMLEEKDKVIDLMAEEIDKSIGNTCPLADYKYDLNCENECNDDYKKCWKQYFENKANEIMKENT